MRLFRGCFEACVAQRDGCAHAGTHTPTYSARPCGTLSEAKESEWERERGQTYSSDSSCATAGNSLDFNDVEHGDSECSGLKVVRTVD